MKMALPIILVIHGLIHFMGFAKAFDIGNIDGFEKELSRPIGLLWLLTGLLFIISAVWILVKRKGWPVYTILAVIVSQILIIPVWGDAKYGTIANIIILLTSVVAFGSEQFESSYKKDVVSTLGTSSLTDGPVTQKDYIHLPPIVQRYLDYVGAIGKSKVYNMKITMDGEMREKGGDWFKFTSEQYNFFDSPVRLFFMKAKVKGLQMNGYHRYMGGAAKMRIKLLSLFTVVSLDALELFSTETVTYFNDLCLFAPAALIDDRIIWEALDNFSAKATFTTNNTSISATLYFNETGQLINFVSNDRHSISEMKRFPFSTPARNYKNLGGYNLPTFGEAVWHYPDGEFVYGKFNVKSIEYNIKK